MYTTACIIIVNCPSLDRIKKSVTPLIIATRKELWFSFLSSSTLFRSQCTCCTYFLLRSSCTCGGFFFFNIRSSINHTRLQRIPVHLCHYYNLDISYKTRFFYNLIIIASSSSWYHIIIDIIGIKFAIEWIIHMLAWHNDISALHQDV